MSKANFALVVLLCLALAALQDIVPGDADAQITCPRRAGISFGGVKIADATNPLPAPGDIVLPGPCGAAMVFRVVCVPATGALGDKQFRMGCRESTRPKNGFMDGMRTGVVAGAISWDQIPKTWTQPLDGLRKNGQGLCPSRGDGHSQAYFYLIGKYEVTTWQWQSVMTGKCPDGKQGLGAEAPKPVVNISYFEADEFARRYTLWLLKNHPEMMPTFKRGRRAYLRLPTEAEWEFAAKGGHMVSESDFNASEFYPFGPHNSIDEFANYSPQGGSNNPDQRFWIGKKCSNPVGLHDTQGNVAEMVLEPFHLSVGNRLHGAPGGLVAKGGQYEQDLQEIMPCRRAELPLYLNDRPYSDKTLGFRLVLSAIVTADERMKAMEAQWGKLVGQHGQGGIDQNKDLLGEVQRLIKEAPTENERKNLRIIQASLMQNLVALNEQENLALRNLITTGVMTLQSITSLMARYLAVEQSIVATEKTAAEETGKLKNGIKKIRQRLGAQALGNDKRARLLAAIREYSNAITQLNNQVAELKKVSLKEMASLKQPLILSTRYMADNLDKIRLADPKMYQAQVAIVRKELETTQNSFTKKLLYKLTKLEEYVRAGRRVDADYITNDLMGELRKRHGS